MAVTLALEVPFAGGDSAAPAAAVLSVGSAVAQCAERESAAA